jgi:hypothetical protein
MACAIGGCAVGELSGYRELDPYAVLSPKAPLLPPLSASNSVPVPAIALSCGRPPDGPEAPIAALRPGVGARLQFSAFNVGFINDRNGTTPLITPASVSLRLVDPTSHLDSSEHVALTTFLITNHANWVANSSGQPPAASPEDRAEVHDTLLREPARYWNAFVRSMCIEVRPSEGMRVFVPMADMAALCRAAPESHRAAFARAFINAGLSDCPAPADPQFRSLVGVNSTSATTNWPEAALRTARSLPSSSYFSLPLRGPIALEGAPQIDVVRPFGPSPPNWSLRAWEDSAICRAPDGAPAIITGLRFKHGARPVGVLEDPLAGSVRIEHGEDGLSEHIDSSGYHGFWMPTIARNALEAMTAADVDELTWAATGRDGVLHWVEPQGCVRR